MISEYEVIKLMKRNFCYYFENDRQQEECRGCRQLKPCEKMETTIREILAKKEKHDQKFVNKFEEEK